MSNISDQEHDYYSQEFHQLDLSGRKFHGKEFDTCTFSECDLSEVQFEQCKFIDCQFIKCNLGIMDIRFSKFSDVTFEDCKAIGIDWTKANWPGYDLSSPLKFHRCLMNDSSFFGLNMEELVLEECKVFDVDFRDGNFQRANFTYSEFDNSLFHRSSLGEADFTEAVNYDIDIAQNNVKGAIFTRFEAVRLLEYLGIKLVD